jgi:B12-binding domain/radical SAM domain protein
MTPSLIFYYNRLNCYSFNALAGAIDTDPAIANTPISLPTSAGEVREIARAAVKKHNRATVALSIMTCQFEEMRDLIRHLRSDSRSRIAILAGGPHATACPKEVLAAGADVVFCGEAEQSFPATLKAVMQGDKVDPVQVSAGEVNLDTFTSISPRRGMFGPIEITRGCAFACSYCQTSRIFGTRLRHRSVERIVEQAATLRSGNRRVVRLLSPNAFSYGSSDGRHLNTNAMRELLAGLRESLPAESKIIFAHFPSEARPEHIIPETLDMLKEFADNDEIVIGAQSGSRRMLEACRRAHTVEDVLKAVLLARSYGYKVIVDFIHGLPGESEEDLRESLAAMEEVVRMGARIHSHLFAPLPQTPFSKELPGAVSPAVQQALNRFQSQRGIYNLKTPRTTKSS